MNPNFFTSKKLPKFVCSTCDYNCCKKGDWNRHILTDKHNSLNNPKLMSSNHIKTYKCSCGKEYKHMSTLCAHKKKCLKTEEDIIIDGINIKDKDGQTALHRGFYEIKLKSLNCQ
jgi:hypothetical protein